MASVSTQDFKLVILTISLNCFNAECAQFLILPYTLLTCAEGFLENKPSAL
jgi:hypothetical protein